MVFLQGLISESGVAVNCFELSENGIIELFVSEEVLAEFKTLLHAQNCRQNILV